ncbi:hypothetical protein [uncultured Zobellia sp.]|uniref:hypothetical protein n=1 Tax=uncultured Zobellia sp. TaxID=255433 RepID=UPI0025962511|nr:hypothetical protein [uncultured Zobellia sp.]
MKKKFLAMVLVSGCLDLLLLACCPGPHYGYLKMENITLQSEIFERTTTESDSLNTNTLALLFVFETVTIASQNFRLGGLSNAYATTCPGDGENGLKTGIDDIRITATSEVLGIPAGQPLNVENNIDVYRSYDFNGNYNEENALVFSEFISHLNSDLIYVGNYWYLHFKKNLPVNTPLKFHIEVLFLDGTKLEAETESIQIQ